MDVKKHKTMWRYSIYTKFGQDDVKDKICIEILITWLSFAKL